MRALTRLVWSEGMYLSPHHFQRQSRYFEDSLWFATTAVWYKAYGLAGCELDSEALQHGTVSILHARGVLPDGLCFDIPNSDPAPETHNIADAFSPTRDSHIVLLCIPRWRPDRKNVADLRDVDRDATRYITEPCTIADEMSGRDEKSVDMGRKNFRLRLDSELDDELVTLPLARIRRDGAGRFVYDRRFVPPLLQISASDHVMTILHDLCELLDRKNRIVKDRAKGSDHLPNYNRGDLRDFWFLHAINSSLPALRHQLLSKKSHPEELYRELAQLAGALSCFSMDGDPRDLPLFSHDDFGACMELLVKSIHDWLELIERTNLISIPFVPKSPSIFGATVDDQRCFDSSRWILGIRSQGAQGNVATKAPQLVKVCSEKFVEELVRRALPGMTLTHLPVPPARLETVETEYFGITKEGPCWNHIMQTKHVGVYVPGELPDPKLELHVLLGE